MVRPGRSPSTATGSRSGWTCAGDTLAARGWTRDGGDLCEVLARLDAAGCARYVVTDIRRDGTMTGPNLDLLRAGCARPPTRRSSPAAACPRWTTCARWPRWRRSGVEGAIVGKALYAGAFTLPRRSRP